MDEILDKSSGTSAPPPPSEVKVRTMRSDLESMTKSGGGLPNFQNVAVSGAAKIKRDSPISAGGISTSRKPSMVLIVILILTILLAGAVFAYMKFFSGSFSLPTSQSQPTTPTPTPVVIGSNQTTTPVEPPPVSTPSSSLATPQVPFTHTSLFKIPADQIVKMTLGASNSANSSADLQTYNQKLFTLLSSGNKNAATFEIDVKAADGHDLGINELLTQQNAQVLDPSFLAANFSPDATFFAYHDKNGYWPGYIIGVNQGTNAPSLQVGVAQIESSPNISSLFLLNTGAPSASGFTTSTIAASSVRVLSFSGGATPASFTYGWTQDHNYLILSTSQAGFAAALKHLGE